MDPNYAHEYDGSGRSKCKRVIGARICGLPEDAPVHTRAAEAAVANSNQIRSITIELDPVARGYLVSITHCDGTHGTSGGHSSVYQALEKAGRLADLYLSADSPLDEPMPRSGR